MGIGRAPQKLGSWREASGSPLMASRWAPPTTAALTFASRREEGEREREGREGRKDGYMGWVGTSCWSRGSDSVLPTQGPRFDPCSGSYHSALHHPPAVPFPPSTLTLQVLFHSYISAKQAEGQDLDQSAPCLSITLQLGEGGRRDMQTAPGMASRGHS